MEQILTISKNPELPLAQDYEKLRSLGIQYLEKLGTELWTDFNSHDPGISILEVLCYALSDIAYRAKFEVKDLIAHPKSDGSDELFSARDILHNGPLTISDYRKILIDIEGINNAWLDPAVNQLEVDIFANCEKDQLQYDETEHPILLRGLYEVFLEFSPDDQFGDLNDSRLEYVFSSGDLLQVKVALNFPFWKQIDHALVDYSITDVQVVNLTPSTDGNRWLVDFEIEVDQDGSPLTISIEKILIQIIDRPSGFNPTDVELQNWLSAELTRIDDNGVIAYYQQRLRLIHGIVNEAWKRLQAQRNLCEDFLDINSINVEEVSICADVSLRPEADIEEVLARIYFEIEKYCQPAVKFYSLEELLADQKGSDEIFEGPALEHGFILDQELATTDLRSEVRTSDLIDLIMDIPGVETIENVLLTKTTYAENGNPIYTTDRWCLSISPQHKPSLSIERSKILFFKSGLPFLAGEQETLDTLAFLKAVEKKAKIKGGNLDLPFPAGNYVDVKDYTSIQHDFPITYGLAYNELAPSSTSVQRLARNKQMKAYLLFFDQILGNYLCSLSEAKNLFSFKKDLKQSYFAQFIADFADVDWVYQQELAPGSTTVYSPTLEAVYQVGPAANDPNHQRIWSELMESEDQFFDRRNRFLDHLMARFAEQFTEYTLLLFDVEGTAKDKQELIDDKRAFLKDYPITSSQRAKAFDYTALRPVNFPPPDVEPDSWNTENVSGLQKRLSRLIGVDDLRRRDVCQVEVLVDPVAPNAKFKIIRSTDGAILLSTPAGLTFGTDEAAKVAGEKVLKLAQNRSNYELRTTASNTYYFILLDELGDEVARRFQYFTSPELRKEAIEEIISLLDDERIFLFEHILLRPKRIDDRLLQVCLNDHCEFCGEEDPYSFRISLVLPSWPSRFNRFEFRRFVEQTARLETPAHIALKICWPNKEQFVELQTAYQAWLLDQYKPLEEQDPDLLGNLIEILENLRTVYPEARLHDCEDGNDDNPILLNRTILGTSKAKEDEDNNP